MVIFLNYMAGYYVIFWVMKRDANQEMMQRLNDDNYSSNETITIKFPFALPYYQDWNSFERVNGSFQYKGEYYKFVKQKLQRDTLYIVCIKDPDVKRISGLITDFVKQTNDQNATSKTIKIVGNFSKDYQVTRNAIFLEKAEGPLLKHKNRKKFFELFTCLTVPTPPPKG